MDQVLLETGQPQCQVELVTGPVAHVPDINALTVGTYADPYGLILRIVVRLQPGK